MENKVNLAFISHPDCLLHEMGESHPEQPARITVIDQAIKQANLNCELKKFLAPLTTYDQILRVHDANYINSIFIHAPKSGVYILDADTQMNSYSLQAALRAAGAVVKAVDLLMSGEVNAAFCNVRPPGHHAERAKAMGFCLFNNLAIGVAHALSQYHLERIAIVDFDVHHGNGTEDIFKNEKRVLLCSSFQHPFYPGVGAETKSNHIINVPLPVGTEGKIFRKKVSAAWFDVIKKFNPEMIFFSAGFDGHKRDLMSGLMLTEDDYAWLTREINSIAKKSCQGRIISVLEGGYELHSLGSSVAVHLDALL